jgi:hypothetical protein
MDGRVEEVDGDGTIAVPDGLADEQPASAAMAMAATIIGLMGAVGT